LSQGPQFSSKLPGLNLSTEQVLFFRMRRMSLPLPRIHANKISDETQRTKRSGFKIKKRFLSDLIFRLDFNLLQADSIRLSN